VDDGEFRSSEDVKNQAFLDELEIGYIMPTSIYGSDVPTELKLKYPHGCYVAMDDRRSEGSTILPVSLTVWKAPVAPKVVNFVGKSVSMAGKKSSEATKGEPIKACLLTVYFLPLLNG